MSAYSVLTWAGPGHPWWWSFWWRSGDGRYGLWWCLLDCWSFLDRPRMLRCLTHPCGVEGNLGAWTKLQWIGLDQCWWRSQQGPGWPKEDRQRQAPTWGWTEVCRHPRKQSDLDMPLELIERSARQQSLPRSVPVLQSAFLPGPLLRRSWQGWNDPWKKGHMSSKLGLSLKKQWHVIQYDHFPMKLAKTLEVTKTNLYGQAPTGSHVFWHGWVASRPTSCYLFGQMSSHIPSYQTCSLQSSWLGPTRVSGPHHCICASWISSSCKHRLTKWTWHFLTYLETLDCFMVLL